jgi:hypothetical protein
MPILTAQSISVRLGTYESLPLCLLRDFHDLVNEMHFHEKAQVAFLYIGLVQEAEWHGCTAVVSENSPTIRDLWQNPELQVEMTLQWGFEDASVLLCRVVLKPSVIALEMLL